MNTVVPFQQNFGVVSKVFAGHQIENAAAAGIQGSYASIGYRGKNWSIRYQGNERIITREDGSPQWAIELVVVRAAVPISKIFYERWVEGMHDAPDCFSTNGVIPDPGAKNKQATACKLCPKNAWGSRINENGKAAKACRDARRIAVVPATDIANEPFDGPMLLRIPAASLSEYAEFSKQMERHGYPYNAFVTKIAFDPNEGYPKFVFTAVRPLNDTEAAKVLEWYKDEKTQRILSEEVVQAAPQTVDQPADSPFEQQQPAQPVTPTPTHSAPPPVSAPVSQPVQASQGLQQPVQTMTGFGSAQPSQTAPAPSEPVQITPEPTSVPTEATPPSTGVSSFDEQLDQLMAAN